MIQTQTIRAALTAAGSFTTAIPITLDSRTFGGRIVATATVSGRTAQASALHASRVTVALTGSATAQTLESVTYTATVSSEAPTLPFGGTVTFLDGATPLAGVSTFNTDANGNRVFTVTLPSLMPAGPHSISARFDPSATTAAFTQTAVAGAGVTTQIDKRTPILTGVASPQQVRVGDPVRVTATVSRPASNLPAPTGQVSLEFFYGSSAQPVPSPVITLVPNSPAAGSSSASGVQLAGIPSSAGSFRYHGDDVYRALSASAPLLVAPGEVTLNFAPVLPKAGEVLKLSVTVVPPNGSVAPLTGSIEVSDPTRPGSLLARYEGSLNNPSGPISVVLDTRTVARATGAAITVAYVESQFRYYLDKQSSAFLRIPQTTPKLNLQVYDVQVANTQGYRAAVDAGATNILSPTGTVSVYYASDTKPKHTFNFTTSRSGFASFLYLDWDLIVAIPGTTFPIRFVYSGDADFAPVEATCNAIVALFINSHLSCNTGPVN